jgi:hypothetical protein
MARPKSARRPWSSVHYLAGNRATPAARPLPKPVPLALEVLEDRTLLNIAPVLSLPQTTFSVVKTTTLSVTVSATDKDSGEVLTFGLVNAPAGAAISSTQVPAAKGSAATGTLTWTPTPDQGPASYSFAVTVTDNGSPPKSASQNVTVTTLAAGLVGNNLLIVGTNGNDTASVSAPSSANSISVTVNGATTGPFTVPPGGQIIANLFGGNDAFTLNESPVKIGPVLAVDGGTGANALTDNGTSGADAFAITGSVVSLTGAGDLQYTNVQSLTVNGLGGSDSATVQIAGDFNGGVNLNTSSTLTQVSVSGTVSAASVLQAGNVTNVTVGTLAGQLVATAGSVVGASITSVSATGLLKATEVTGVPGSGVLSGVTITTLSGTLLAGSINGLKVTTVDEGAVIKAAGQGTTTNVSIGTLCGSFTAPEDSTAGSGVMSNTTIDSICPTGTVSTGSISGMSVGSNSGSITAAGQGTTTNVSIGTLCGSFTAPEDSNAGSGVMSNTTIDSICPTGTVSTGSISGMSVGSNAGSITAAGAGVASNINIGTLSGTFAAMADSTPGSGALNNAAIGTLTAQGTLLAASVSNLTITTAAGTVNVSNALTSLAIGTALPTATFKAGHFNLVTAVHASPIVNLIEPTVTRTVAVTPHMGTAVPDFGLYYDGSGTGDPRAVVEINAATPGSFDLGVTTSAATTNGQGFDLAGLYSAGNVATGIHNAVVGGDLLLGAVPAGAVTFFGLPAGTAGGVQLPQDNVAVAVAGNAPAASIIAKAVPALAAGSFGAVSADAATNTDALVPLAAGTGLIQANDSYQVFASEANHVAQFLVTGPGSSFDNKKLVFADQVSDNRPVTATDFLVPAGSSTAVNEVDFTGQGGSLTTSQPILAAIKGAPGASLGDLILGSPGGITANITADSIIGNIDATNGGISGVIQTTVGDLGRALTDPTTGKITGVTFIHTGGGGLTSTGKIISKANLVSQLNLKSGLDGVVAAGGDIGVIQLTNGLAPQAPAALTRFGGIAVSTGGLNGQVVALGNAFGDISVTGGLSGRIAVKGQEEFGLSAAQNFSRTGILGNVSIGGGISPTGAIVSAALLGDDGTDNIKKDTLGTQLTISGADKGILAAEEDINFGATGSLNTSGTFENVGTPGSPQYAGGVNKAAIDNIFTDGGVALTIPDGLSLILQDLLALTVGANGNLTGTRP